VQLVKLPEDGCTGSTEAELVSLASAGDKNAFASLYERYLDPLFRYFYYRVGHRQDAEDLTEQVFLKAWQNIANYKSRGTPFSAWLYRIAHNLLVDYHRTRHETEELDDSLKIEDDTASPDELLVRREEARELASALVQLSPVEQSVVVLRLIQGLDHRTVASIIGKSETATRSIQSRALARLARILEARERRGS